MGQKGKKVLLLDRKKSVLCFACLGFCERFRERSKVLKTGQEDVAICFRVFFVMYSYFFLLVEELIVCVLSPG